MRKKSDSAGEMKALISLVNLLPKVAHGRAGDVSSAEAGALCVRVAKILDEASKSNVRVQRPRPVKGRRDVPDVKISLDDQIFEFSSEKYIFTMEGHAVALQRFLIACRETLLVVAAKTVAAHHIHISRYYPLMYESPRQGDATLTDIMPTERQANLRPGWVSVPATPPRGFRVEADGRIRGVDPYHDGFVVVLLRCDARRIRVCEVCHDLFYARTGNQRGCGIDKHRNLVSQRVHRKRERAGRYKPSRQLSAKLKTKRKAPTG